MPTTLTIKDKNTLGAIEHVWSLDFLTEHITVRELIRSRVYQEVQDFNTSRSAYFNGLVTPTDAERALNGDKLRKTREIDWKRQYHRAVEAFMANQIIILIDDQQVDSLDAEIEVKTDTDVTFLRLVPLVGG